MSADTNQPPQTQEKQPGKQHKMVPEPATEGHDYRPAGKLQGKIALVSGGDSGIGQAVAVAFAKEGANIAITFLEEKADAEHTRALVEKQGAECLLIQGDTSDESFCQAVISKTIEHFGALHVLVNNAGEQHPQKDFRDITGDQLRQTFATNVFGAFYLTRAALEHLPDGGNIINSTSVTAYRGSPALIDYSATKGALVSFTRSLALNLVDRKIRVNAVAPGPVWTPLIPATFDEEKVANFGAETPMGRAAQPEELAPAYVYLACDDSSYVTGQVIHVNGGEVING